MWAPVDAYTLGRKDVSFERGGLFQIKANL